VLVIKFIFSDDLLIFSKKCVDFLDELSNYCDCFYQLLPKSIVAWYFMNKWLQEFAYRLKVSW